MQETTFDKSDLTSKTEKVCDFLALLIYSIVFLQNQYRDLRRNGLQNSLICNFNLNVIFLCFY